MAMDMDPGCEKVVIVGASHVAAQLCVSLRQTGWSGEITVIGDEKILPYHRPPLSKEFLSGNGNVDDILICPASVYDKARVNIRLGIHIERIDPDTKTIVANSGEIFSYDKLVLATGARVRRLPVIGGDTEGVLYLRNIEDVLKIKTKIAASTHAVIIGGGYIGLETAASLRRSGLDVTVLEASSRILQRVTAPALSDFYRRIHTEEGVEIIEGITVLEIKKIGQMLEVSTECKKSFQANLVIVGIGVLPNIELAQNAGLATANGIVVNEFCQTSNIDIYAAGDVAWHYNPIYDTELRLESVPNAIDQAKTVAMHITGQPKPYSALPWFWSQQFDVKLQIAGLSLTYDNIVIRGDVQNRGGFSVFYFKGDKFLAVDALNAPRDFVFGRQALTKGLAVDKSIVADVHADLKTAIL